MTEPKFPPPIIASKRCGHPRGYMVIATSGCRSTRGIGLVVQGSSGDSKLILILFISF
jgi:hypothetical protein